jgi:hypothetical protein
MQNQREYNSEMVKNTLAYNIYIYVFIYQRFGQPWKRLMKPLMTTKGTALSCRGSRGGVLIIILPKNMEFQELANVPSLKSLNGKFAKHQLRLMEKAGRSNYLSQYKLDDEGYLP